MHMRHVHVHVRPPQVNGLEKMLVALVRAHGRPGLQTVGCRRLALISLISIRKCKVHMHICMCDCAHILISIRGRKVLVASLFATTYHLPPTTYHLPPTTYRLPPTTYRLPPTAYRLPPTAYHLPPTTYYVCPPGARAARRCGGQGGQRPSNMGPQPPSPVPSLTWP
jgi:hypothetical protein